MQLDLLENTLGSRLERLLQNAARSARELNRFTSFCPGLYI